MVKEIDLAVINNFNVNVICFELNNWSTDINLKIIDNYPEVNFIIIPSDRKKFTEWIFSTFLEKIFSFLSAFFNLSPKFISYAISKRSFLLKKYISKIKSTDIVVGHNPGALYATYFAARKFKCKSGFDVEDYHPGEGNNKKQQKLIFKLMQSVLTKMDYVSFAAPLIKNEVEKNIYFSTNTKLIVVLNYFSRDNFNFKSQIESKKIKFVWFSQNIDFERGLENIIPTINKYKEKIELHLYGNSKSRFSKKYENFKEVLIFHPPLNQNKLHEILNDYDIGLSLETSLADFNREICLTNKIITYFQSGLYILATNTLAQNIFIKEHPNHGITFNKDFSNFEVILIKTIENISKIRLEKSKRFNDSQIYNWENESKLILLNWNIN